MAYNFKEIGKRIEENRRQLGMKSASALSEAIESQGPYYSRQMIRDWETGKDVPPEEALLILCNLFNCDLGYLLCEYDCKTRTNTDIAEETGLSEAAIEKLRYFKSSPGCSGTMEALNTILLSANFENTLGHVGGYLEQSDLCRSFQDQNIPYIKWEDEDKERNYEKYEAATNFSYTLDEIGSTPERRQRIFKAGMKGLFD